MNGYDIIGNIVIVKFRRSIGKEEKRRFATRFLKEHKNVKTVLEKTGKFGGRLRTQKSKFVLGEKTREALYRENGCEFLFDVDTCYFSPRLAGERLEVAKMAKKKEKVLVMFGGVGAYGVVISKIAKCNVVSVELGKDCNKYAKINIKRNKLADRMSAVQGDVRRVVPKLGKFDRIVMPRPNLKDSFLDVAFNAIRKGIIHYYGFYDEDASKLKELINSEAKKAKRKIKILRIKKAGDIGVRKFRYRADIKVS